MLSKAVNGYTAAQVDAAIAGLNFPPIYRVRAELLDRDLNKIRDLVNLILSGSKVYHKHDAEIQRACELLIREANLELDLFAEIVLASGPLFHLRLGEASGATAADASGNGRTFTYNGGVTYGSASLLAGDPTNTAITLNGSTGYLSAADAAWMDVSSLSLMIWRKGTGSNRGLFNRDNGTTARFFDLKVDSSGNVALTLTFTSGSPATKTFTATGAVNDGNAYPIYGTYDGAHVKIYAGTRRLLKTAETRTLATGTLGINIGRSQAGGGTLYDNATLDEVAMWNRALTSAEITEQVQAGKAELSEVDYNQNRIKIYYGVGMVEEADPDDDADWAEWPLIVAVLTSPSRESDEFGIFRRVTGHDLTRVLMDDKFGIRWTVAAGENYISGTHGVLAIAQSAGFDTSSWSVTSTASTLPSSIDFKINDSKLEGINYLLEAISYKKLRFRGDGSAVIEPNVLISTRSSEDTLASDDSYKIIGADRVQEGIDTTRVFNIVTLYKGNPDAPTLRSQQVNDKLSSDTSTISTGVENEYVEQVEAADQTAIDNLAKERLTRLSQVTKILTPFETLPRPFHDDDDIYTIRHVTTDDFENALEIIADFNELEWELSLDPTAMMRHVLRSVVSVTT